MLSAEQSDSLEADEEADFVTRQVRLRMGRFYDSEFVLDAARLRDRLSAVDPKRPLLIFRIENGAAQTVYENTEYAKNRQFMENVTNQQDDGVYCADFEDSMPTEYFPFSSDAIPLFSKNRPVGADTPVILWTHANYRRNREAGIAGRSSNLPWKKKIPELIWRGSPRGSVLKPDGTFVRVGQIHWATIKKTRHKDLFFEGYRGRDFKEVASGLFDRFRLISRYADKFNVRFVDFPNAVARNGGFQRYLAENYGFAERMPVEEIARYKYLFVLGGNDAGTQINWALSARSVILMPPIRFHSTTTLGLKEWVHYVPVATGLGDLEEKVEWCRQNDKQCRAIARNAWDYVSQFTPENENLINDRVIARYNANRR